MMKLFCAIVVNTKAEGISDFQILNIKALTKEEAWKNIEDVVFFNPSVRDKMIVLEEVDDIEDNAGYDF